MQFTHEANPVKVNARQIVRAIECLSKADPSIRAGWYLEFADGLEYQVAAYSGMLSRYVPAVGDYLVTQEDGYEYFNPKDVFERKYRAIEA